MHRHRLHSILSTTAATAQITTLVPEQLQDKGITALALDFDGVLAGHGADKPLPEVVSWIDQAVAVLGEENICILSNRPVGPRVDWFSNTYPLIRFIHGVPKKPDPLGVVRVAEYSGCPVEQVLVVDDRLSTGILAGILAHAQVAYIRFPYQRFSNAFWHELFFSGLRYLERGIVRLSACC